MTQHPSHPARHPKKENCPACFEEPKERYRVKTLLAQQEHLFPKLMVTLLRTMQPLLIDSSYKACTGEDQPKVDGNRPASKSRGNEIDPGDDE